MRRREHTVASVYVIAGSDEQQLARVSYICFLDEAFYYVLYY